MPDKEENLEVKNIQPLKKKPTDDSDDKQAIKQEKAEQPYVEKINQKLEKQQETLNKISDTLKDMNTYTPPKEKKEEKKDKKPKLWDDFFKDIVKTTLKFGGGLLVFLVLMGAFIPLSAVLFTIGFACLLFTDPAFEVYEEKLKPTIDKWYKSAKEHVKNAWAYHKQKKAYKRLKKEQQARAIEKEQQTRAIAEDQQVEKEQQVAEKTDGITTQEKPDEQKKTADIKLEQPVKEVKPIVVEDKPKQDNLLANKTPLNVAPKKDVQAKLFKKCELNPIFVKSTEKKDNAQTL